MDNSILGDIDTETLQKAREQKPKYVKKVDIELKHRKRRKNAKIPKIKEALRTEMLLQFAKSKSQQDSNNEPNYNESTTSVEVGNSDDPLARFVKKKSKK